MTLEEAKKVAEIASTADDGCFICVRELKRELEEAFPEFVWGFVDEDSEYKKQISVSERPSSR